jgi:hypothetical protein
MLTEAQNIDRAYRVAGTRGSAVRAHVPLSRSVAWRRPGFHLPPPPCLKAVALSREFW